LPCRFCAPHAGRCFCGSGNPLSELSEERTCQ
jgi:hypothetical protein